MAQTDVEKLVIALEARTKEYEKALARVQGQTVTQMRRIERTVQDNNTRISRHFARMGTAIGANLKAGIAGAIAGLSIDKLISASIDAVKSVAEIGDLAETVGLTAEQVQNYNRMAIASGASSETMAKGLQSIAEQSADVESKLAELFAANGLQVQGMAANDVIRNFSELLKNAATPADQLRIITEVLGDRVGRQLVEAMRVGAGGVDASFAEMLESGLYHSNKQVEYIQKVETEYNKSMNRLAINWEQLVSTLLSIGSDRAESSGLVEFFDAVNATLVTTKKELEAIKNAYNFIMGIETTGSMEADMTAALQKRKDLEQQIADLRAADRPPIEIDEYIDRLEIANNRVAELQSRLAVIGTAVNAPADESGTGRREPAGAGSAAPVRGVTKFPPARSAGGREKAISDAERHEQAVQRVIENLRFENAQMGQSNMQQEINNELRAAGVTATSEYGQQIADMVKQKYSLIAAEEAANVSAEEWLARQEELYSSFMDLGAMGVSALDSIIIQGEEATTVMQGLVKQLASAALQAALLGQGPLAGLFGTGGGGGLLGSLLGGLMPVAPSQRAGGGHVNAGQVYEVNERGNSEYFIPDSSGTIRPKVSGGGFTFAPVIDARGADAAAIAKLRADLNDMAKNMAGNVKAIVSQEKRLNPRFAR